MPNKDGNYEQLLSRAGVQAALEERAARLDTLAGRLQTAARGKLQAGELRLKHTAALAASLNPYGVLARGYAMVQDNRGRICTPDALRPGQTCKLRGTEHRSRKQRWRNRSNSMPKPHP